jgi:uncharacterized protein
MTTRPQDPNRGQPWWRFGIVWLVIAGPVAVVLASTVTAWVAWRNIDPVIREAPVPATERDASNAPALKVRNHAATPRQP